LQHKIGHFVTGKGAGFVVLDPMTGQVLSGGYSKTKSQKETL